MIMSFYASNCSPALLRKVNKTQHRKTPSNSPLVVPLSLLVTQAIEGGNSPEPWETISGTTMNLKRGRYPKPFRDQVNTIGIIGGISVSSTLIFLEKLVWWSGRDAGECFPFVVCSDPSVNEELVSDENKMVENLKRKRVFLEKSGASCIVMPCHVLHNWYAEISDGCCSPFLHVGDCVARELKEAQFRPLEAGSRVRIGVLATDRILSAGFYQDELQSQGFEVVLLDKATMEHILIPAIEALDRRDIEGAQNLLRVAIQVLLVRAVNAVVLASDDLCGILPENDPLMKKCIDPMDSLARSTINLASSRKKCS